MLDKKAIFINTSSQILVRISTLFFALLSIKLLTNYLGTSGTGYFNTVTTYLNFFIIIADLGLFSVAVREIAKNPDNERKIISNVFTVRLISALISTFIAVGIVFLTDYDREIKFGVLIASGFILFNLLSSVYDIILQTRLKMQFSSISEFLSKMVSILALFIIIQLQGNFLWIMSTVTISGITILLLKYCFARKFFSFKPEYDKKVSTWIMSISFPIGIVFVLNNLFFKIDTLLLFAIKGASVVGIYSVAYKILEVTLFAGSYFASALKPNLARDIVERKDELKSIISKSIVVMLIISAPIALISILFSKEIIIFLSNADFMIGSKALVILSLAIPFVYINILLGEILIANDERKLLIQIAFFILSFNLILNLIFIPKFSFIGAALVTLLSEIVLMIINIIFTRRIIRFVLLWEYFLKILVGVALTYAFGMIVKNTIPLHFMLQILICSTFFILLCFALKIINKHSIKDLLRG